MVQWRLLYGVALPFILLPLPLIFPTSEARCGYVVLLMALLWLGEPIPLSATALLPIVLFPILGIASTSQISSQYMKESLMLVIGSLTLATALEKWDLHRRIALKALLWIGPSPRWLILSFLLTPMFLSMWSSNVATTVMMVAIAESVINELKESHFGLNEQTVIEMTSMSNGTNNGVTKSNAPPLLISSEVEPNKRNTMEEFRKIKIAILLSISYGTNLGGPGTLNGTPPNLLLKGIMEDRYPLSEELTYSNWMIYNIPGMLIRIFTAWIYLQSIYVGFRKKSDPNLEENVKRIVENKYKQLGKIKFAEIVISLLYVILITLWITRDPKIFPGWASDRPVKIGDATPAILIALLLFVIPSNFRTFHPPLLDWPTLQKKMPWGVLLLLGGGFALAEGSKRSGLSEFLGQSLANLNFNAPWQLMVTLVLLTCGITEILSNTATASVIIPVIAELAVKVKINPLYLMLPVTISSSFAFMFPVATPPNAIIFETGNMKMLEMVIPGIAMNIICCAVEILMISTLGVSLFNLNTFPSWANTTLTNSSSLLA